MLKRPHQPCVILLHVAQCIHKSSYCADRDVWRFKIWTKGYREHFTVLAIWTLVYRELVSRTFSRVRVPRTYMNGPTSYPRIGKPSYHIPLAKPFRVSILPSFNDPFDTLFFHFGGVILRVVHPCWPTMPTLSLSDPWAHCSSSCHRSFSSLWFPFCPWPKEVSFPLTPNHGSIYRAHTPTITQKWRNYVAAWWLIPQQWGLNGRHIRTQHKS